MSQDNFFEKAIEQSQSTAASLEELGGEVYRLGADFIEFAERRNFAGATVLRNMASSESAEWSIRGYGVGCYMVVTLNPSSFGPNTNKPFNVFLCEDSRLRLWTCPPPFYNANREMSSDPEPNKTIKMRNIDQVTMSPRRISPSLGAGSAGRFVTGRVPTRAVLTESKGNGYGGFGNDVEYVGGSEDHTPDGPSSYAEIKGYDFVLFQPDTLENILTQHAQRVGNGT